MPSALVLKLRKQPEVRDAEALAAWIGRYQKLRKAGVGNKRAMKLAGKQGGMKEGGVKAEDRKTGGSDSDGKPDTDGITPKARSEIEKREKEIRGLSFEKSVLVDNEGNVISTSSGSEGHVMNSPSDLLKIKDGKGMSTHNHPDRGGRVGETSFSEEDFRHFLQWRPSEFRAVTANHTFRLRGPEGGWGDRERPKFGSKQVEQDFQSMRDIVEMKAAKWRAEGISSQEMDFRKTDEIARMFAKAYGLRYDVEKNR